MYFYIFCLAVILVTLVIQFLTRKTESSFVKRLLSGIILVAAALVIIMVGGWLLYGTSLVLSLVGVFELYRAVGIHKKGKFTDPLEIAGYVSVLLYYLSLVTVWRNIQLAAVILGLVVLMFVYVFTYPEYEYSRIMQGFFGIVYVGVMLSFVYQTRMLESGQYIVWLIFLCSWGCDTCAYCAGRLFGRHKMSPVLSPNKTIEGGIGGVLGAILLGMAYAFLTEGPVLEYMIICFVGALISMVGDLAASAIKRNAGIKDYSQLIPGHGGVLDRFDSVIFTSPIIFFLATILI